MLRNLFSTGPSPQWDRFSSAWVQRALQEHDASAIEEIRVRVEELPWGEEALRLGRSLAGYEDQSGQRKQAELSYDSLLARAGEAGDLPAQVALHLDLAEMSQRWNDYDTMESHLAIARETLNALDDLRLQARLLRLTALLAAGRYSYSEARSAAEQALALYTEAEDWPGQAETLVTESYIALLTGRFADAATFTSPVLDGDRSVLNPKVVANALSNYGYALRRTGSDREAVPFYEQALAIHTARLDPLAQTGATASLGVLYMALERYQTAYMLYLDGILKLEQMGMPEQAAALYNNLGQLQYKLNRFEEALASYQQALRYDEQLGNTEKRAISTSNIGFVYRALGDHMEAADWWERAATLFAQSAAPAKAVEHLRLASKTLAQLDPPRSVADANRALVLAREVPEETGEEPAGDDLPLENALLQVRSTLQGPGIDVQSLSGAVNALVAASADASQQARDEALCQLAGLMPPLSLGGAAFMAMGCGGLVEHGADPLPAVHPLLDRLSEAIRKSAAFVEVCRQAAETGPASAEGDAADAVKEYGRQVEEIMPEEGLAWRLLDPLCVSACTVLSGSADARRTAREDDALLSVVESFPTRPGSLEMLRMMLRVLDGEELLVLYPALERGYRVRMGGIADNFQLHTLLAAALVGDPAAWMLPGKRPDPRVVAAAKSSPLDPRAASATGYFNMSTWRGLQAGGMLDTGLTGAQHWIWGEGMPADIEPFEGVRVVLLDKQAYSRGWDAGRRFPAMRADLRLLEILTPTAVRDWLGRIAAAPR